MTIVSQHRAGDKVLPPIELDEYRARIENIRMRMRVRGIDALLLTAEANFRYVTGFNSQTWVTPTRPRYCILPLVGEPIIISPTTNFAGMRASSWIADIRCWPAPRPADDGISLVREALREALGGTGVLGAELGAETRLGMPVGDFQRLCDEIAPATITDAGQIMAEVRTVKSPAEIARIRSVAEIVSQGFADLPRLLSAGLTEKDACRALQIELLRHGADRSPYLVGVSGRGGYPNINVGPSDRCLQDGDMLIIDTGSTLDGYFCDFDREFFFGRPDSRLQTLYAKLWGATQLGIESIRPGVRACDVWRTMAQRLEEVGLASADVGRMGHGVGTILTEPPSIHPAETTVLEPGMVLAVEPGISFIHDEADGPVRSVMVHEENVVVTEEGCELLSERAPRELTTIT